MVEINAAEAAGPAVVQGQAGRTGYESQWALIRRRFLRHRLGVAGGIATLMLYVVALLPGFFAPTTPGDYDPSYTFAPPQRIEFFHEGRLQLHVTPLESEIDYDTGRRTFVKSEGGIVPLGFFVKGAPYRFMGLVEMNRHLFGPTTEDPVYLAGADRMGRDILSRTIYGARVSMTIGLIGVTISLFLGILIGGISGYFGGVADIVIQRLIEFIQSVPAIPLWIGLAAAIPIGASPLMVYFLITVILSVIGWTGLARVVRGRFLSMRSEDYVAAAQLDGCSVPRILFRHMLPGFYSHIIATVTLAVPSMILAETALSYLGIGLRQPVVSWGVLLQEAQNVRTIAGAPWLLLPGGAVVIAVLALNFLGDGLRDAADPYET